MNITTIDTTMATATTLRTHNNNNDNHETNDEENNRRMRTTEVPRTLHQALQRQQREDWPRLVIDSLDRTAPLLRPAVPSDIPQVRALLSRRDNEDVTSWLSTAFLFLVLHQGPSLVGFLVAHDVSPQLETADRRSNSSSSSSHGIADQTSLRAIKQHQQQQQQQVNRDAASKSSSNQDHRVYLAHPIVVHNNKKKNDNKIRLDHVSLLWQEFLARVAHHETATTTLNTNTTTTNHVYALVPQNHAPFLSSLGFAAVPTTNRNHNNNSHQHQTTWPRLYYARPDEALLRRLASPHTAPFYDATSMRDPHCVGIGLSLYWAEPPEPNGTFYAHVRVCLKWRQPGIDKVYQHPQTLSTTTSRTMIDLKDDTKIHLRRPRFTLNEFEVNVLDEYAYLDKNDPEDVISLQQVLRGTFIGPPLQLSTFPADQQTLEFQFRMWDHDSDDRCRYFCALYYSDQTAWPLGVKRPIASSTAHFGPVRVSLGVDDVAGTSRIGFHIPVQRNTAYYLRTVAIPLFFVSSLTIASIGLPALTARLELNTVLLLTVVAYLFVTKDETPRTSHLTRLDILTYACFLAPWSLVVLNYIAFKVDVGETLVETISYTVSAVVLGLVAISILEMRWRYKLSVRRNPALGSW